MERTVEARRWAVVALAFAAIMLNYVDRQMIALLKPTLQDAFGWSDRDYGHMASAFQFAAALSFLGAGWFVDKVGLRRGFAIGVGVWSLAGMAHAVVASVAGFVGARAVLGAAEAIGTPAQVKAASTYFPPERRSLLIGLGNMAPNLGAVVTPLLVPPLALWLGWRAAFLLAGGLGLVWVALWWATPMPPELAPAAPVGRATGSTLRDRRQWALVLAKIFSDDVWWFMLFFAPDLFHRMFGLSQGALGVPVAAVYAMAALGALGGGWLPSRLLAAGWGADRARKLPVLLYALLIVPVAALPLVHDAWSATALLGLALFAHQGFSTNVFGFATDVFPAHRVATAIGVAAFAGNLSGMAMIEAAGWSLDAGRGYAPLLGVCAGSYLVALACIQALVPRIRSSPAP